MASVAKPTAGGPAADDAAGIVAHWPGPAARIGADGRVRHANGAAGPLLAALGVRPGGLRALATLETGCALDPIEIDGPAGASIVEPVIVPLGDGIIIAARDVSLATNMRAALADSRRRYKDLVEISSDFVWETDASGAFVFVSPRGALGFTADELLGRPAGFLLLDAETDGAVGQPSVSPFAARERIEGLELWTRGKDGAPRRLAVSALPLVDANGVHVGARGLCRDVSDAFAHAAALGEARNRERLLAYVVRAIRDETVPDAMLSSAAATASRALGAAGCTIWRLEADGSLRLAAHFGEAAPASLDITPLLARPSDVPAAIVAPDGRALAVVTFYRRAANGAILVWRPADRPDWTEDDRILVAGVAGQLGIAHAQIAQHEALSRLAQTDTMTGLLNRRAFTERLAERLAQARRSNRVGALLYIDLDNFKLVNDRFGHERGDEALKRVAAHLKSGSRIGDIPARLGGDEFALWLEDTNLKGAVAKARTLLALNAALADLSGDKARPLGLSVGVAAHIPGRPEGVEALIARADSAMYNAKRNGKNGVAIAAPAAERGA
jgi:diguanylate cyclase (GGDEF)-like protein/PAS domain S-box-containing protein